MTEITALLETLRANGVALWVEGNDLRLRAPSGVLTAGVQAALREHKTAILAHLMRNVTAPIPRVADRATYELSLAQRRLWLIAQLDGGSAAYHIAVSLVLEGALDEAALGRAFDAVGNRHESLRTTFVSLADGPHQRIAPAPAWTLIVEDCSADADPLARARTQSQILSEAPFDLQHGPLVRALLLRLAPARHVLTIVMHHIVADGWSLGILARELSELYNAFRDGATPVLAPLALRYRDYAAWQRAGSGEDRAYWLERLKPPLPQIALPADFSRPPIRRFQGELVTLVLSTTERRDLERLAQAHHASLFMLLCALTKVLIYRYTGERDLLVGTPVAGRPHPDLEDQIGYFLNTIVLRDRLDPETPFAGFLGQVSGTALEAYAHADYPFDEVVNACDMVRDMSRSPLFDVQVSMQNTGSMDLSFAGIEARPLAVDVPNSKCDLALDFDLGDEQLTVGIRYDSALFRRERIERLGTHFRELARSAIADPQQACGRLNLLTAPERAATLELMNGPALDLPPGTLLDRFAVHVRGTPDRIAARFDAESLTYRELDRRSSQIANGLAARIPAGAETPVGVFLERGLDTLATMLGILKAGFAYVPMDPDYPAERIEQMLRGSSTRFVVSDAATGARLSTICERLGDTCEQLSLDATASAGTASEALRPPAVVRPEMLAYVLFTSGSTGAPKGVEIEHRSLLNFLCSMQQTPGMSPADVLLAVTTISFDIAGLELLLPLITGACVVIAAADVARDGIRLAERLDAGDITMMQGTPSTWSMLLAAGWGGNRGLTALCGGEALSPALARALAPRCAALWNLYGPTETTIWSSVQHAGRAGTLAPLIGLGRPIHNTRMAVLDAELQPVPAGVVGDLYIGGAGVARGYRGQPERTAERFIPDPFAPAPATMYRTGDLARSAFDGSLEFAGRSDYQLKIRGHRIEAGEVESAIMRYDGVREAVVTGVSGTGGDVMLCGYVVFDGGTLDIPALRAHLETLLPGYMIPSAFVQLTAFPHAANGKVDRGALPAPGTPSRVQFVAPRNATEALLAAIWQSVLEVDPVSVEDDFFELGGHSLKATRVAFAIQQERGVRLNLVDIFRNPTIAQLALILDGRGRTNAPPEPVSARELEMLGLDG